jgi:hypothetical protein
MGTPVRSAAWRPKDDTSGRQILNRESFSLRGLVVVRRVHSTDCPSVLCESADLLPDPGDEVDG